VSHFSGADLAEQLDVHVASESALPKSKAARTQLAIDLFTQGILGQGPEANKNFLRMLDMPGTDFIVETLNLDAKQAEREHGRILQLEQVVAEPWHDHLAHLMTHTAFMKSEEYEQLHPLQQQAFLMHLQEHYVQAFGIEQTLAPSGAPAGPEAPGSENENPTGANGEYLNPITGRPNDPLAVAAGQAPSSLQGSQVQARQGVVGGTGNPGPVPGQSGDSVAARTGN
jgi:hypothetical protein